VDLALETLLGRVSLVGGDHLDESEAARFLGVRVAHDITLLNLAVLLEETRHLFFSERRVDTGDEEVGARVAGAFLVLVVARSCGWATEMI
jgi:hypothetical protein